MKSFFLKAGIVVVLTLLITEVVLRTPYSEESKIELYKDKYMMMLFSRVNPLFIEKKSTDRENLLIPPYDIIANEDVSNPARLDDVYRRNRNYKNEQIESFNFLKSLDIKSETRYNNFYNNFGFRSAHDFKAEKDKNTYRVITYGSYQAYGFGIDESKTYSRVIEQTLNAEKIKKKYEVWNSARIAGTSIIGLAQFSRDISDYKPDLVIFDYGFVDAFIIRDNIFPIVMHFDPEMKQLLKYPLKGINFLISHSVLFHRLWIRYSNRNIDNNVRSFFVTMKTFINLAKANNIKVIVLKQPQAPMPGKFFENIIGDDPDITYVDVESVFETRYSQYKDKPMPKNFWLDDYDQSEVPYLLKSPIFKYPNLRLDLWQINEDGHQVIGEGLARIIKDISTGQKRKALPLELNRVK